MAKNSSEKMDNSARLRQIREVLSRHRITRGITPEKLREILEELGPTYIKLGQIMSLHSDILPQKYCDEQMKLNSEVPPMPFCDVEEVISHSYRTDWHDVFRSMEETPLGSASIAQVHRAVLKSGEQVVVKVQRKGIYDVMARDIGLLHRAVGFLPPIGDLKNLVDLDMVLDEMWQVAQEEMDFLKEAANMQEFARYNRDVAYVRTPKLYREYTTGRVLVMEYIDGPSITDAARLRSEGYDLKEIGSKLANNFIKQVMEDGFFHADPHPGNVKVQDGKIVWIDMGMMGRLTDHDRQIMVKGVTGIAMHDVSMVESAVLKLGVFRGKTDRGRLFNDLKQFLDEYGSLSMGEVDIADAMQSLMEIMKHNKISMPHGMTMLARGLAHLEGDLVAISPDISMVDIAVSRITDHTLRNFDWKKELAHDARVLYRSTKKGAEIPSLAADALKELLKGQTTVNLNLTSTNQLSEVIYSSVRNLVIGLCVAALLMGSSILCTTGMEPTLLGIPLLGAVGFLAAIGMTVFLVLRYFINRRK